MNKRYPPDADYHDLFDVSPKELQAILSEHDEFGREAAIDLAEEYMSREDAEDTLEWFGR